MGIDVYLRWNGQTVAEEQAQYTGFSIEHGHVGYLREAYHGSPYATKVLVPEGWGDTLYEDGIPIKASTLRERLPAVLKAAEERERNVYNSKKPNPNILKSYEDFVALAERKEAETGEPCRIIVSA